MRINIYDEEVPQRMTVVEKTADDGRTYVGLRLFSGGGRRLGQDDEDISSAVTFWTRDERLLKQMLRSALHWLEHYEAAR